MRLNLYWRGRDVIDVEVHLWRMRPDQPQSTGPKIQAASTLADSERAEHQDSGIVGFGFAPPS